MEHRRIESAKRYESKKEAKLEDAKRRSVDREKEEAMRVKLLQMRE